MYKQIETIRTLWRGELMTRKNSFGKDAEVTLAQTRPAELPIWPGFAVA